MYIVSPTYAAILGAGVSRGTILYPDQTSGAASLPTMVWFKEAPYWMNLLGMGYSNPILIELDNLEPQFQISGDIGNGTLTFGGRIAPGGGYYATDGSRTLLIESKVGNVLYNSAPYRFPYEFASDGVRYGDDIYKKDKTTPMPKPYADNPASVEWKTEFTDKSATITPIALGWWEKKSNKTAFYGVYVGKGTYKGRYIVLGTATWISDEKTILKRESLDGEATRPPNIGNFIYDNTTHKWWLDGIIITPETGAEKDITVEWFEDTPKFGKDIIITVETYKDGRVETSTKILKWGGFIEGEKHKKAYICEIPAWREVND